MFLLHDISNCDERNGVGDSLKRKQREMIAFAACRRSMSGYATLPKVFAVVAPAPAFVSLAVPRMNAMLKFEVLDGRMSKRSKRTLGFASLGQLIGALILAALAIRLRLIFVKGLDLLNGGASGSRSSNIWKPIN